MNEARITINGVTLTTPQAMTLRVAVTSFHWETLENGLGDDEHGKFMAEAYVRNCEEIFELIFGAKRP